VKSIALVTLETDIGVIRRYLRAEGNKPEKTGEDKISNWDRVRVTSEPDVVRLIQAWRTGYVPPEFQPPRPTGPKRTEAREAIAA
jgi:hypothetical protein